MKHLFKKTMCVAVAVLLLVGSLVCAQAATVVDFGTYADGISWALDSENTLHVYGSGAMTDYACPWHDYQPVIEKVIVYSGITHIGGQAFTDCTALADVSVPDSVTSIGVNAFFNCTSLTEIEIPDSVTDIYDDAFTNSGYYNDESNWENGVLYIDEFLIEGKTDLTGECIIKDGTRIITCGAFQRCNSMTCVVVPDSVKTISQRAFIECAALESVTLPESITTLDENAFFECTSLTNIVIPENVTVLSEYLFYGCSSLASVTIPASVTSIEPGAFGATALTDVYYTGSESQWNAIIIEDYNDPLRNATVHFVSLPGDVDLDGVITASDARLALRASVGLEELDAIAFDNADYNKDGTVSADDARSILRKSVGLDEEEVPPVEPEEPTVPVEPDTPTEHTHSYVDFACECGEVQDGHFHDFVKAWILANYTNIANGEYQLQLHVTYEDGSESVLICAYDPTLDLLAFGSLLEAYDYVWMTLVTFPDDGSPALGYIEAMDGATAETVGSGRFEIALQSYVADEPVALTEFDGYEEYREYYEAIAGIGMTEAITVLHDHLRVECGYIFGYTDMGMPSLYAGSK